MSLKRIELSKFDNTDQDERRAVVDQVREAAEDIGFLLVDGHAIPADRIAAMRETVCSVFNQPTEAKEATRITPESYRGYIPLGFFTPNANGKAADQYEGYKLHVEIAEDDPIRQACPLYGPNRWPDNLPAMRDTVLSFWRDLDRMSDKLLRLFALALGLEETRFLQAFKKPLTNMTLLHYPPMPPLGKDVGIHPHKDATVFTILYPDPVGGLLVRTRDGDWIEVDAPDGCFVVNIGDIMEHWSGGRFVSTPHMVVNRSGRERYSFPYFAVPRHSEIVEPLVDPVRGYQRPPLAVGPWQAGVWRSNWANAEPIDATMDPGAI